MNTAKIMIRKANECGTADHGWLQSHFSFSFADYYDQNHMGFHALRVINDDIIAPGRGFGMHPHENMEIISYVVKGALEHKDSMGNSSIIRPHEIQQMSAGSGVRHSEFNPSDTEPVRLIQIWIKPNKHGVTPSYDQKTFPPAEKTNRLRLVASPNGTDESIKIHQDAWIYAALLHARHRLTHPIKPARNLWLQMVNGSLSLNGHTLKTGDGAAMENGSELTLKGIEDAEFLLFDLA